MNERIKELAHIAGISILYEYDGYDGHAAVANLADIEKFAELIVKECAKAADMAQDAGCEYAGDYVAEYMGYGEAEGVTEWRAK